MVVAAWAAGCFAYNHFYADGPYYQDSGQYAFVLFRAGLVPKNPPLGYTTVDYFGLHLSPAIAIASVLSYAFPGDRVQWFCLLNALAYVPLGLAIPLLLGARRFGLRRPRMADALVLAVVSVAFVFSGQVISCIGFPHHEILIAGGLCLMLAGIGRGKRSLVWAGIGFAVAAREDGGLHAASFLGAATICGLSGRPFSIPTWTLARWALAAALLSALAFTIQFAVFSPVNLFRGEYLGVPAFVHLRNGVLVDRLAALPRTAGFVVLPLAAAVAIAVARRDARYALGWIVALPWLLLNLLAAQDLKAAFQLYTGFPFVASVFWLPLYATIAPRRPLDTAPWRRGCDVVLLASIAGTIGLWHSHPHPFEHFKLRAFSVGATDTAAVEELVAEVQRVGPGKLYVDASMAAWTIDTVQQRDMIWTHDADATHDGAAFFRTGMAATDVIDWLAHADYSSCGRLRSADVFLCVRPGQPLFDGMHAASPILERLVRVDRLTVGPRGWVVVKAGGPTTELAAFGPFATLTAGKYVVRWADEIEPCDGPTPPRVDVYRSGTVLVEAVVVDGTTAIEFDVAAGKGPFEFRAWTGSCPYVIKNVQLTAAPTRR